MSRPIWTLRESEDVTPDLWRAFKQKATDAGFTPTAAIGRMIRRYLDRGFDDGQREARSEDEKGTQR